MVSKVMGSESAGWELCSRTRVLSMSLMKWEEDVLGLREHEDLKVGFSVDTGVCWLVKRGAERERVSMECLFR